MARENPENISLAAAADYKTSSKQYYCMDVDTNGKAVLCSAAGQRVVGILQNKPNAGEAATIATEGISKVISGTGITAGDYLKTDANGKAVKATKAGTTGVGSDVFGIALTSTTDIGATAIVTVLLQHAGLTPSTNA